MVLGEQASECGVGCPCLTPRCARTYPRVITVARGSCRCAKSAHDGRARGGAAFLRPVRHSRLWLEPG